MLPVTDSPAEPRAAPHSVSAREPDPLRPQAPHRTQAEIEALFAARWMVGVEEEQDMPVFDRNRWPAELLRAEMTVTPGGGEIALPDTEPRTIAELAEEQRAFLRLLAPEESESDRPGGGGVWTSKVCEEDR